jgi:hypothetical protein
MYVLEKAVSLSIARRIQGINNGKVKLQYRNYFILRYVHRYVFNKLFIKFQQSFCSYFMVGIFTVARSEIVASSCFHKERTVFVCV